MIAQDLANGLIEALAPLRGQPVTAMTRDMAHCEISTYMNKLHATGVLKAPVLPNPEKWIIVGGNEQTLTVDFSRRGFLRACRDLEQWEAQQALTGLASIFGATDGVVRGTPADIREVKAAMKPLHEQQHLARRQLRCSIREQAPQEIQTKLRREILARATQLRELHEELEALR